MILTEHNIINYMIKPNKASGNYHGLSLKPVRKYLKAGLCSVLKKKKKKIENKALLQLSPLHSLS